MHGHSSEFFGSLLQRYENGREGGTNNGAGLLVHRAIDEIFLCELVSKDTGMSETHIAQFPAEIVKV